MLNNFLDIAIKAAVTGGRVVVDYYQKLQYEIHSKQDTSFQTTADVEAEDKIAKIIKEAFPDHRIYGEECGSIGDSNSSYQWIVDPLDGTENFILGIPYFSISIALCNENVPIVGVVFNPIDNQLYVAEKGKGARLNNSQIYVSKNIDLKKSRLFFIPNFDTKRQHNTVTLRNNLYMNCRRLLDTWSPALDWCLVSNGNADGVVIVSNSPIKPNAGTLILEEAGGLITDFVGQPFVSTNSGHIVASNNTSLHKEILRVIEKRFNT